MRLSMSYLFAPFDIGIRNKVMPANKYPTLHDDQGADGDLACSGSLHFERWHTGLSGYAGRATHERRLTYVSGLSH